MPKRLAILGGGVIGVEFASIFRHFGTEVTIVEMLEHLIPMEDADASKELERAFKRRGIAHAPGRAGDRDRRVRRRRRHAALRGRRRQARRRSTPTSCWSRPAAGRARTASASKGAGVEFDPRRGVIADRHMRTNVAHIYAVGDVAGVYQLAHTAFREGEVAAENALGHEAEMDYSAVPRCVYTDPEVAAVGLTEAQAREQHGDDVVVGRFPFSASARAQMYGEKAGFAKTIHETRYGELLGLVIVGAQATELVNAGVIGISAESTIDTIGRLDRRAPDARRGGQGGGAGRARAADPPAAAAPAGQGRRPVSGSIDASRFLIPTLKDDPADAEAISHKLLVRGGFVRQLGSGLYTYLPLGWKVLQNTMQVIREEMDTIGLEMLMPVLQPAELWQATNRYDIDVLFKTRGLVGQARTCSRSRTRSASPTTPPATSAPTASCRRSGTTSRRRSATSRGRGAGSCARASSS